MKNVHPLNWIQWVTLALVLCVGVTVPLIFLRLENVQRHQNDALRSILCRAENVVRTEPGITVEQRRQALSFYEHALAGAHLAPCTESE